MNRSALHAVAVIGDAGHPQTWSGIPWHFCQAARERGWATEPWRLDLAPLRNTRRWWNAGRLLQLQRPGGFQYSRTFLERAEASLPAAQWQGRVLTFSQHFPRVESVRRHGGRLVSYIDATFASFCQPGGLEAKLPAAMQAEARQRESENLQGSEKVVTMARWAIDSVTTQCGVPRERTATILPGANLALPDDFTFQRPAGRPGLDRPLVLGFVGKDWQRKGLPFVLQVRHEIEQRGFRAEVHCAGHAPRELVRETGVRFVGFLDKAREPARFLAFLSGCDVGCLFSSHEPLGISTLEFLRAGVPVAGFAVEGLADTLPPDAGFRFAPGSSAADVAETLLATFRSESRTAHLRAGAEAWSPWVTWQRCLQEWHELLTTGRVLQPIQPWRGSAGRPASMLSPAPVPAPAEARLSL